MLMGGEIELRWKYPHAWCRKGVAFEKPRQFGKRLSFLEAG